jgi:hypothetical protein
MSTLLLPDKCCVCTRKAKHVMVKDPTKVFCSHNCVAFMSNFLIGGPTKLHDVNWDIIYNNILIHLTLEEIENFAQAHPALDEHLRNKLRFKIPYLQANPYALSKFINSIEDRSHEIYKGMCVQMYPMERRVFVRWFDDDLPLESNPFIRLENDQIRFALGPFVIFQTAAQVQNLHRFADLALFMSERTWFFPKIIFTAIVNEWDEVMIMRLHDSLLQLSLRHYTQQRNALKDAIPDFIVRDTVPDEMKLRALSMFHPSPPDAARAVTDLARTYLALPVRTESRLEVLRKLAQYATAERYLEKVMFTFEAKHGVVKSTWFQREAEIVMCIELTLRICQTICIANDAAYNVYLLDECVKRFPEQDFAYQILRNVFAREHRRMKPSYTSSLITFLEACFDRVRDKRRVELLLRQMWQDAAFIEAETEKEVMSTRIESLKLFLILHSREIQGAVYLERHLWRVVRSVYYHVPRDLAAKVFTRLLQPDLFDGILSTYKVRVIDDFLNHLCRNIENMPDAEALELVEQSFVKLNHKAKALEVLKRYEKCESDTLRAFLRKIRKQWENKLSMWDIFK